MFRMSGNESTLKQGKSRKTPETFWTTGTVVFIAAFISCFLWGSASPCIRTGYGLFGIDGDDTPSRILFAGVRFTIAGLMVIAFDSIRKRRFSMPKRTSVPDVLILMCFQTVLQYIFYYSGVAHTTSVRVSLITASGTFFSIFMAVAALSFLAFLEPYIFRVSRLRKEFHSPFRTDSIRLLKPFPSSVMEPTHVFTQIQRLS